jgi:hypothetical protein
MTVHETKHQAQLQQWTQRITDCRTSGQNVRQWCAEKGINTKTYYRWEREAVGLLSKSLTTLRPQTPQPVFVPVEQTISSAQNTITATIMSDGIQIDIHNSADPAAIQAIIAALRSC